jgi:hypothetical protein
VRDKSVELRLVKGGRTTKMQIDWDTEKQFNTFGDNIGLMAPGRIYKAVVED